MKTLDEICIEHGTDKGSKHVASLPHDYARHYDLWFSRLKWVPAKILEIGVGGGESIRTWLEYFNIAEIFGVDLVASTNQWNTPVRKEDRYTFVCGDQSSADFWKLFLSDHGKDWNVVIDDGSHANVDVITTFLHLWPAVAPGGLYCIEDLGAAYGHGSVFVKNGLPSQNEFLKAKIDELHQSKDLDIDSIYFACELAIIKKKE